MKITCVFCGQVCNPAPTDRGWSLLGGDKALHFDCARKVAAQGDEIDRLEGKTLPQLPEPEDWTQPKKNDHGMVYIDIPDELQPILNNLAMQLRFHTISGLDEMTTLAQMVFKAQKFFYKMYCQGMPAVNKEEVVLGPDG